MEQFKSGDRVGLERLIILIISRCKWNSHSLGDQRCGSVKHLAIIICHSVELPGGLHELNEVVVVVNGGADSGVVLVPLISLDLSIVVSVTEVLEEFQEHLVFGLLAVLHLGVHAAVVDALEVGGGDFAITVLVELKEGLVNHSLSPLVELAL